jgi:hypothetical protein
MVWQDVLTNLMLLHPSQILLHIISFESQILWSYVNRKIYQHLYIIKSLLLEPYFLKENAKSDRVQSLVAMIKGEARLWARAGASGFRVVMPATWDVH